MGAHTNNYEIPIKIDYYITLILYVGTYTYIGSTAIYMIVYCSSTIVTY